MSLLNELEDIHTYLDKEDAFFFTMVYDPTQKTLLVDKGEIRVGTDYQAEISPYVDPGNFINSSSFFLLFDKYTIVQDTIGSMDLKKYINKLVMCLSTNGERA